MLLENPRILLDGQTLGHLAKGERNEFSIDEKTIEIKADNSEAILSIKKTGVLVTGILTIYIEADNLNDFFDSGTKNTGVLDIIYDTQGTLIRVYKASVTRDDDVPFKSNAAKKMALHFTGTKDEWGRYFDIMLNLIPAQAVTISNKTNQLTVGVPYKLVNIVYPFNATDSSLSYFPGDRSLISINEEEEIVPIAPGFTNIAVKTNSGNHYDYMYFDIVEPPPLLEDIQEQPVELQEEPEATLEELETLYSHLELEGVKYRYESLLMNDYLYINFLEKPPGGLQVSAGDKKMKRETDYTFSIKPGTENNIELSIKIICTLDPRGSTIGVDLLGAGEHLEGSITSEVIESINSLGEVTLKDKSINEISISTLEEIFHFKKVPGKDKLIIQDKNIEFYNLLKNNKKIDFM